MKDILNSRLHQYIKENNPDLLLQLEEQGKVSEYLSNKISSVETLFQQLEKEHPAYIIEETCMNTLTEDLRPSKFNYICNILEEEFEATYHRLREAGALKFEAINLIEHCQPVFDELIFIKENEDDRQLKYLIIAKISDYLDVKK